MDEARERERLGEVGAVARVTEQHLREDFDGRLQGIQFQMAETADRADYRALCAENPLAVKYRAEVEQRLADERRRGLNFPRETVLKFIVGERALQGGGRALTAQRKKAEAGIRREKVDAPRGTQRSDVSAGGSRGNDAAARAKRLENIEL